MALFNKLSVTNFTASTIPDDFLKILRTIRKLPENGSGQMPDGSLKMLQFCGNGMRKKESGLQDICGKKFRTEGR